MNAMSEGCRLLREGQPHFQWFNCGVWLEAPTDTQVLENVFSFQCALGQPHSTLSDEVEHGQPGSWREKTENLRPAIGSGSRGVKFIFKKSFLFFFKRGQIILSLYLLVFIINFMRERWLTCMPHNPGGEGSVSCPRTIRWGQTGGLKFPCFISTRDAGCLPFQRSSFNVNGWLSNYSIVQNKSVSKI